MLHKEACSGALFELLTAFMQDDLLSPFVLVGGTALSLQLGHRQSEDIDLFCYTAFNAGILAEKISAKYPVERMSYEPNTINCFVNGIKTDLLLHQYPLLDNIVEAEGLRLAPLKDIAAMKLNAISGRGMKKDFWDIAALMDNYCLSEMIGFFKEKYITADTWHLLKALSYLQEADTDQTPIHCLNEENWGSVKRKISFAVNKLL